MTKSGLKINNCFQSYNVSNILIYLFLFLICFSIYFNSLNNDFIFDDNFLIVKNLYIRNLSFIPKLFKTDIFHFHLQEATALFTKYYRPLQALSYAFEYLFYHLHPFGYRLTNIIIQSLNSFLVFLLISLILKDRSIALLSAVLFCIHPMQVCLVAFIAGRSNLLETLFMFLSLLTFIYYSLNQKKWYYTFSLLLFIFALLSREGALLLLFFIFICAIFLNIDKRKLIFNLMPYVFIAAFYIGLRAKFIPCDKFNITNLFSLERISNFIWYMLDYVGQLILPVGFQVAFFGKSMLFKSILFSVSFIIAVHLLIKAFIHKDKIAMLALTFYFIGILPIINLTDIIHYFGPILSEHYVYIASIGFFIYISYLILKLCSSFKKIATVCLIIIICFYSTLTVINNTHYKDELTFYNYILSVDEKPNFMHINLGTIFYMRKMYDKAFQQANLALVAEPDAWDAYLLLGNIYKDKGNLDKAMELYNRAVFLNPQSSEAFNNLGLIYKALGKDNAALENIRKAVQIDPEATFALQNLIDLLTDKRLYTEALRMCEKLLNINPEDVGVRVRIGIILAELGSFKEAEIVFKEALKLDSKSVEAMKNLGSLYGNMRDFDKAISLWRKALEINPYDEETINNLQEANKLRDSLAK